MNGYLKFDLVERKSKTAVYLIRSVHDGSDLGKISWFSHWRRYVFFPLADTIFDSACLGEIREFIGSLKQEAVR